MRTGWGVRGFIRGLSDGRRGGERRRLLRGLARGVDSAHSWGGGKGWRVAQLVTVAAVVCALEDAFGPAVIAGTTATWAIGSGEGGESLRVWVPRDQVGELVDVWLMPPEGAQHVLPRGVQVGSCEDLGHLVEFLRARAGSRE